MLPTPTPSPHGGGSAFNPPPAASVAEDHDLQLTVHRFNQLFPVPSFMRKGPAEPLGSKLAELFQAALQLAKTKDSLHLHVVRKFASDEGLERIKEMIDAIPKTSRLQVRHWQLLLQPFFQVIAHCDAFTTAHERPLRAIHDFLLNSTSNYIEAVYKHVCCVTSIFIATDEGSNLVIVEDLLDLSSKILKQILSDTSVDSLSSALRTTVQELHGHCDNLPGNLQRLSSAKETLDHILQTREKAKTHPVGLAQQQDFVGYDPPGELSPRGPRHDNDHASIMDIRILPTVGEILAKRLPYAPLYDSSSWHVSGFRGLLDRHFRLLREDQLGPICNVIKQYLQESPGSTSTYSEGNHVRTNEYTLRSLRVSYDRQDGFELHISTDQPPEVAARRTPAHREQWWVDTQNLDWERLVVIVGKSHAMFCLVSRATCRTFAQLHEKNDKNKKRRPRTYDPKRTLFSSSTHAYAVLSPINPIPADIDFILSFSGGAVHGVRLVEFPSVLLPSFKPMLMALQAMYADGHAPLSEYLVGDAGQSRADEHVAPPAYTTNLQLDLRSLTKNDSNLSYCVRNEPNTEQLCARSTLDQGQATAVLNTLRRRLALIQGPPGTGKSFTGEAIIKILLANKSKAGLGPIICICQTNHALDQLLEHLYHRRGIRRIVRLGAFSKSAIVGEMTLSKIMETTQPLKNELVANGKRSKARRKVAGQVIRALEDFSAADHGGREGLKDVIMRLNQEFERCAQAVDKGWSNVRARILREYDVVGVTTSGLAKFRDMLSSVGSKVVLCEEAGEVLEAHTLSALMPNLEHLILIGDHQQLRPRADNWAFRVANPDGKPWSWDISLFERLVKPLMFSDKRIPFDTLNVQRRMHPSIANLVRSTLYPSLQDAETVKDYPPLAGFKRRLYFYHHSRFEDKSKSGGSGDFSFHNRFEVEVVKTVLAHLHRQNVYGGGEIAVLTPYAGQLQMLKAQLGLTYDITMNDLDAAELETRNLMVSMGKAFGKPRIRVATVDNFQGEEASVIIVSLVRSNPQGKCGFLDQENRINVLLSRAKHGMIIIGNSDTYVHSDMWWKVLQTLENDGNVGTSFELPCPRHKGGTILASTAQHFINGSCKEKCGRPLQCSHICMETCHTKGVHDTTKCQALCGAILSCGHQCKQSCHFQKQCGPCDSTSHRNQKHHVSSAGSTLRPAAGNRREPSPTTKPASSQNRASKPVAVLKPETRVSITTAENRLQQVGGTDHLGTENALHVADDLAKIDSGICESLIAFISTSHRRLVALELALLDEQDALHKSLLHAVSVNQVAHIASKDNRLVIDGQPFKMIQTVHDAIVGRYISAVSLMLQMNNFLREMIAEEKRFDNLISNGKSQERSAKFGQADCCLRLQSMLSAVVLLIRCNVVLLADFLSFRRQTKGQKPTVSINLDEFRFLCQFVVSTARQSCYPRHEVEAHVLIAKMITIAREVSGTLKHANGSEDTAVAERHLQEARDLALKHKSLSYLLEDVEAVQGELSSSKFGHIVSSSTKRARWKQSGQEFQKTGYWHVCANGHPFSLEEEAACTTFCFECDAPAGEHIIDRQDNHKEDCAESFDIDSEADDDLLVRLAQDFSRLDI